MESAAQETQPFRPPYMSFATFWSFVGELAGHPLPPVIDRSLMNSKSGTDQANLLAALRAFGLIDDGNRVQPALLGLAVTDPEPRKRELGGLIETHYAAALAVSRRNGTPAQLKQCFTDEYSVDGDTGRKSITFFLHAARTAEIELSPHFPTTRSGQGAPGRAKPRRAARKKPDPTPGPRDADPGIDREDAGQGTSMTVQLQSGGTMTLRVSVNPLSLRGADRTFFYDIVDNLTDYQERQDGTNSSGSAAVEGGP